MRPAPNLVVRAGPRARLILREQGLNPERIKVLAGASGGPKWLVLSGMDLSLARILKARTTELQCIGSSIGSWRLAALAQENSEDAVRTFEDEYIRQAYDGRPSAGEVTAASRDIQHAYISDGAISEILRHPAMRLAFLAVRSRWPGGSDGRLPQTAHLLAAFAANSVRRSWLRHFFQRTLFHTTGFDRKILGPDSFPTAFVRLSEENFRDAVLASGSIPLVMEGMRDVSGAPSGTYRDGGVIDYHVNLPFAVAEDELVFMPHFFDHITPGWFDKKLWRRQASAVGMENMVLVAPSSEFVASLPGGKIPDRTDFATFTNRDEERMALWRDIVARCRVLGSELEDLFNAPGSQIEVSPFEVRGP